VRVTIDRQEPPILRTVIDPEPRATQLLAVGVVGGLIFGLLVGCVAVASGVWILALSPGLVFVNRFLVLETKAKSMGRASWVWPVISVIVASIVVVTVPNSAVLPLAILAAVSLPALLIVTAVIDARAAGTVWRH
jgi:hypothetical protein